MTDPRTTPANPRVAHVSLQGTVTADRFAEGRLRSVMVPVADICGTPGGKRQRQLIYGQDGMVLEEREGYAYGWFGPSLYCGYVRLDALAEPADPTHRVTVRSTHLYDAPSIKAPDLMALSYGSQLQIIGAEGAFLQTATGGWVPSVHVGPADVPAADWVAETERLLGVPYLWGGNSAFGIDCSGLVTAGLRAGPGDSDLQQEGIGVEIDADEPLCRGDLLFWKGHVAICVDSQRMIHANAFHMAVAYEGIAEGIARIKAQGDGDVTARKRL